MVDRSTYMQTLHHVVDGEQVFYPADVGEAIRHPEWKKTPWMDPEIAAYKAGIAKFEALKHKSGDPPHTKEKAELLAQGSAALKAQVAKAGAKDAAELVAAAAVKILAEQAAS